MGNESLQVPQAPHGSNTAASPSSKQSNVSSAAKETPDASFCSEQPLSVEVADNRFSPAGVGGGDHASTPKDHL